MFDLAQFPLPYATDALAPYMSAETVEIHHGRHLDTYIKNLNSLIEGTGYESMPLYEIIKTSVDDANAQKIYNNAAQVFNHDFYFHCMKKTEDVNPVPDAIADAFGGEDAFRDAFKDSAASVFGSGWTWLVLDEDNNLKILNTANADTPLAHGLKPLLTLDVWEHAYYLDYQNKRADFIDAWMNHLVDWDCVMQRYEM